MIAGGKGAEALLATLGMPLIDESESQRNVENIATAASLWCVTCTIIFSALDLKNDPPDTQLGLYSILFSIAAILVIPISMMIDEKMCKSSDPEDHSDEEQEKEQSEEPEPSVAEPNPLSKPDSLFPDNSPGDSFCEHGRWRIQCKICTDVADNISTYLCPHGRWKIQCEECTRKSIELISCTI